MARLVGWLVMTIPSGTVGGGGGGRCRSSAIPPQPSPTSLASPTSTPSSTASSRTRGSSNRVGRVPGGRRVAAIRGNS